MPRPGSQADIGIPMAEQTPETLNHFATLSFTDDYWKLPQDSRRSVRDDFLSRLRTTVDAVHLYQLTALESRGDLLIWSASASSAPDSSRCFFSNWATALASARQYVQRGD